jgi:hypothetical protein
LAFEIQSIAIGGHWASQLLDDPESYLRSRALIIDRLRSVATARCPTLASATISARRTPPKTFVHPASSNR